MQITNTITVDTPSRLTNNNNIDMFGSTIDSRKGMNVLSSFKKSRESNKVTFVNIIENEMQKKYSSRNL